MLGALFGFKGRLSRPGFWEVLASIVLIDVALLVGRMFVEDSGLPGGSGPQSPLSMSVAHWIPWAMGVFTVWSLLAATVKRFHDRGRTGAWVLLALLPMIGWLWLLVDLFVLAGSKGKNRYGLAPHAPASDLPPAFAWGAEPVVAAPTSDAHAAPRPAHDHTLHAPDVEPDHGHALHAHGHEDHGHHDEPAHDAMPSDDSHTADDHAPSVSDHLEEPHGDGHHGAAQVDGRHVDAHHAHDGAAASHASAHVAVAHAH